MVHVPTPMQRSSHPVLTEKKVSLYVKRDDLAHPEVMGNKWRKLKCNLLKAKQTGCNTVVTFGGVHSNHIYATALACHAQGLRYTGIISGKLRI